MPIFIVGTVLWSLVLTRWYLDLTFWLQNIKFLQQKHLGLTSQNSLSLKFMGRMSCFPESQNRGLLQKAFQFLCKNILAGFSDNNEIEFPWIGENQLNLQIVYQTSRLPTVLIFWNIVLIIRFTPFFNCESGSENYFEDAGTRT